MRALERQIVESNEASISNTSLTDMQQVHFFSLYFFLLIYCLSTIYTLSTFPFFVTPKQTMMKLMTQCDEKGFELEVSINILTQLMTLIANDFPQKSKHLL